MFPSEAYEKIKNMSESEKTVLVAFLSYSKENENTGLCPLTGGESNG